jgi:hypothetical protein
MAKVMVEADLTRVDGFPTREELCHHEDPVACYGPAKEAVAAHVPAAKVLARLSLVRVFFFLFFMFCFACGASMPSVSDLS